MNKHINTFSKGITRDISVNKYSSQNMYWAQNLRIVSKDGLATGALTNLDGTIPKLNFNGGTIVSYCTIRDTLIVFVQGTTNGQIYIWEYNETDFLNSATLIYDSIDLQFITENKITSVGRYENEKVQKIYFSDGDTFFHHLNIINPDWDDTTWVGTVSSTSKYTQLSYDIDILELISDITFSQMSLELQTGGNLKAGKIQYSYQLYNINGTESTFSPESNMADLTNSSDTSSSTIDYHGSDVGESVNKSVEVSIDNIDSSFERIRLIALEYTVFNQVPAVRIVGEYEVDNGDITIIDSGQSLGEFTLEEYRLYQKDFYAKTVDVKDNILFAANIKENNFRITPEEFDSRAFRFNSSNFGSVWNEAHTIKEYPTYNAGVLTNIPTWTHAAYNAFNSVNGAYGTEDGNLSLGDTVELSLNKLNPATGTLGGYGENISYTFTTKEVILDEGVQSDIGYRGTYPSQTCEVANRDNYTNPQQDIGYLRDEVYRFAWVPIDKKGRPGFAMWIGDIKFPNNTELPYVEYKNNKTYGNILGIQFTVNIPAAVKAKISGYRIVRVDRTTSDKTILAQGIIGYLSNSGPYNNDEEPQEEFQMLSQASVPLIGDLYNERPSYGRTTLQNTISDEDEYTLRADENLPAENRGDKGFNAKYVEFTSPEVSFNKNKFEVSDSFIEAFGALNENDVTAISGPQSREARNRNQLVSDKFKGYRTGVNNRRTRAFLENNKVYNAKEFRGASDDSDNDVTIDALPGGKTFNNKTCNLVKTTKDHDYRRYGLRGTFNLCTVDDTDGIAGAQLPLQEFYIGNTLEVIVANYKVNKGRSPYGGSSYESRAYNTYYPVTELIDKDTVVTDVYGGDTYISFFAYARSLYGNADPEDGDTIESFVFFPVETSINLELRLDSMQNYINWGYIVSDDAPNYKISETVQSGVLAYGSSYPTEVGDLYRYNSAYSCNTKGKEYRAEPFDFKEVNTFDVRIQSSDVKINGEYTDSWTKFLYNNYLDVDGKHHAITKIITFKNNLFCVQPTAIGVASVNDRSLIQDNNIGALSLGTGGVLPRYDYITDKSGSEFYEGITASDDFLYYVDGRRKRINKIVPGKEQAISIVQGIDSLLDSKAFDEVRVGFDRGYNEVIFSIDNTLTLAFNELIDAFSSSYTFNPGVMISMNKDFFTSGIFFDDTPWQYQSIEDFNVGYTGTTDVDPDWDFITIGGYAAGEVLHKHNVGPKGHFYNSEDGPDDSLITLIINPNGNAVNSYDNLDIRTEATTGGVDKINDTFYTLEAENDYQTLTRALSFTTGINENIGTIKRIGRVWRTPIIPVQTSGANFKRMVDTYLKATLKYANVGYDTFRIHDITCYYRQSNH